MKKLNEQQLYSFYKGLGVDIITTSDGEAWVCNKNSWNGRSWSDCWQLSDSYVILSEAIITPIYKQIDEDDFEIVDYHVEEV